MNKKAEAAASKDGGVLEVQGAQEVDAQALSPDAAVPQSPVTQHEPAGPAESAVR
jgi:hypothetical protein